MISEPLACTPDASPHSPSRRTVPRAAALAPATVCPLRRAGAFLRALGRAVRRAIRALDDHWLGDLIGAVCLFAILWGGLVAAWVLS